MDLFDLAAVKAHLDTMVVSNPTKKNKKLELYSLIKLVTEN